jgi:Icc-related predicted phosphoesterase
MKKSDNVKLWIHGHIHETNDYQVAGCRVVSNPRGYYGFELNPGFDVNKTVEINNSKKLDVS